MPNERKETGGSFRKLWPSEKERFRDHLLRLDQMSRRTRFAHAVSDSFIEDYSNHMNDVGSIVFAYVEDGEVRAAAELKKLGTAWGRDAEAAFTVESAYQDKGVGTELMGRIIRCARNRGVQNLFMSCLADNSKMQTIARKHNAALRFEYGEVVGEIVPEGGNYFSWMAEAVEDRVGYMMAVFDLSAKAKNAA